MAGTHTQIKFGEIFDTNICSHLKLETSQEEPWVAKPATYTSTTRASTIFTRPFQIISLRGCGSNTFDVLLHHSKYTNPFKNHNLMFNNIKMQLPHFLSLTKFIPRWPSFPSQTKMCHCATPKFSRHWLANANDDVTNQSHKFLGEKIVYFVPTSSENALTHSPTMVYIRGLILIQRWLTEKSFQIKKIGETVFRERAFHNDT